MQLDTDLTGLFGITLAIMTLLVRVPRIQAFPLRQRAAVLGGAILLLSIPLAGFVRSITGDLSVPTLLLLTLSLLRVLSDRVLFDEQNRTAMLKAMLLIAVLFYPFALGFSLFDPYRLGYGGLWLLAALLGLAVWSSLRYSTLLALCVAAAVMAWSVDWYESTNLWDYLLDPWLAIYALAVLVKGQWLRWRKINA